jgi:hypothetical protein
MSLVLSLWAQEGRQALNRLPNPSSAKYLWQTIQHNTTQRNTSDLESCLTIVDSRNRFLKNLVRNGLTNPLLAVSNNFDRHGLEP